MLTLLGVGVHAQYAKYEFLVLEVALLDELLEAFPVLSGVVSVDSDVRHLLLLEGRLELCRGVLLTRSTELFVQLLTTIGGGVGLDFDRYLLVGSLLSVLYGVLPLLHLVLIQLGATDVGLLDEEHDVGIIRLLDDALEAVGRDDGRHACERSESFGSDHAISDLEVGEVDGAATLLPLEVEVELALCHSGDVGQDEVDGGVGAISMVHDTVVAVDLFALEGGAVAPLLTTLIAEDRDDGQRSILGEPLRGEGEVDGYRYFAPDDFEGLRFGLDLVGRHGA